MVRVDWIGLDRIGVGWGQNGDRVGLELELGWLLSNAVIGVWFGLDWIRLARIGVELGSGWVGMDRRLRLGCGIGTG